MKNTLVHIAAFLLLLAGAASCVKTTGHVNEAADGMPVGFSIYTGSGTGGTKANSIEFETEAGSAAENHIDIAGGNFRFLIFDTDGYYLGAFKPQSIRPEDDKEQLYFVEGTVDEELVAEISGKSFRLVVLANWKGYPDASLVKGATTVADICDNIYEYTGNPDLETEWIPMYGVRTVEAKNFLPQIETWLGEVDMLRSMAKVEVFCSNTDLELADVKLTFVNGKGHYGPKDATGQAPSLYESTDDAVAVSGNLNIPADMTGYSGANNERRIAFTEVPGEGTEPSRWVLYLPEHSIVGPHGNGEDVPQISLNVKGLDFLLDFKYYADGTQEDGTTVQAGEYFDILRNHCYRYEIVSVDPRIIINYSVADWNRYSYTLDIDEPEYTCEPATADDYDTNVYYSGERRDGALKLKFTMTQPQDKLWVPSISGGYYRMIIEKITTDGDGNVVSVEDVSSDRTRWISTATDKEFYYIYILPSKQYDEEHPNADGIFRISTTTAIGTSELLKINEDLKWNDGDNPKETEIRVTQVASNNNP